MKKIVLRSGLISGGILLAVFSYVFFGIGDDLDQMGTGEVIGYSAMLGAQVMVVIGILQYRNQYGEGKITFGKSVRIGALISLIAAVMFTAFDTLYVTVINPDWMTEYSQFMEAQIVNSPDMSMEEKSMMIQQLHENMKLGVPFIELTMFVTVWGIGLIVSLLSGAFLKRS